MKKKIVKTKCESTYVLQCGKTKQKVSEKWTLLLTILLI